MKKILAIIVSLICILPICAEGHMTFKGVEINGTVESVMTQLENKGFARAEANAPEILGNIFGIEASKVEEVLEGIDGPKVIENKGEMVGLFTGKKVRLNIIGTATSNTAMTIDVTYERIDKWPDLKKEYDLLSSMLADKYGNPKMDVCDVCDAYDPVDDISKDKGSIYKIYMTENGYITILITGSSRIMLSYTDLANLKLNDQERASDL